MLAGLLAALARHGLLMLHDATLPSVSTIVAGEPIRGSWWGHKAGHAIFDVAGALEGHPDVLVTKLVGGKVTFVHLRLAPALLAVAKAREAWQMQGLSGAALAVLTQVDATGVVQSAGDAAKVLEQRLLVLGRQVHTSSGKHVTELVSWDRIAEALEVEPLADVTAARAALEAAAASLGESAKLPWSKPTTTSNPDGRPLSRRRASQRQVERRSTRRDGSQ